MLRRLNIRKANWNLLKMHCNDELKSNYFEQCDDLAELFYSKLYGKASKAIPKNSANPKRTHKPLFEDDCKGAVRE